MTRVADNNSTRAIQSNINRTKKKLEDLHLKGSSLKQIVRPSDNPYNAVEVLSLSSRESDNNQFIRSIGHAELRLNISERALEELTEILNKAKVVAIAQASDFYNPEVRKNIVGQIIQLRNQALAIGNRRIGNQYIFAGHLSLTPPFDQDGQYLGDQDKIHVEISKDFFVPINITGQEIFFQGPQKVQEVQELREGMSKKMHDKEHSIVGQLDLFISALENDDSSTIQNLLERFDDGLNRLITLRTKVGSILTTVQNAKKNIEEELIDSAEFKSKFLDADIAKLFSDITKQQQILKNSYKAGKSILNETLLDFIR